jgi:hypothetical protein
MARRLLRMRLYVSSIARTRHSEGVFHSVCVALGTSVNRKRRDTCVKMTARSACTCRAALGNSSATSPRTFARRPVKGKGKEAEERKGQGAAGKPAAAHCGAQCHQPALLVHSERAARDVGDHLQDEG